MADIYFALTCQALCLCVFIYACMYTYTHMSVYICTRMHAFLSGPLNNSHLNCAGPLTWIFPLHMSSSTT